MTTVYFETNGYAEQVATFEDDALYNLVYDQLEAYAKTQGFNKVTESEA